ncbi:hypothetical protein N752_06170 [Desulforamulus aquiferis]|nr:hypothetical protein N752_06170 [Desulforamulus aquiferis]
MKDGYGFLAPFSSQIASLYVTVPHVRNWDEFNQCWTGFFAKENLLENTTLLGTYERTHVAQIQRVSNGETAFLLGIKAAS